jgi:ankyrin repeat protein
MPLNHSRVLSLINGYLISEGKRPLQISDPNYGFDQLWTYFSNCTISNDNIYCKHIMAIENWYSKLMASRKTFGNNQRLKIYRNEFAFHWNFSQDELTNFFATIIETHHAQNINLTDKIILISDFSQLFALVYKDNNFVFYDSITDKDKKFYNIFPLVDEIFSALAKEIKLNEFICAINIEIYSVNGLRNVGDFETSIYPNIKNLYQCYFNQRVEKLHKDNAVKINKYSVEKFKLWAYYAELTVNPYIRNMLINAKLDKYGLEYKVINVNDETVKKKTLKSILLHSYINTQLIFDNTALANAIELRVRADEPIGLEEKIKQEPSLLNTISKTYEATLLMQAAYLHKNRAVQKLIENGARTELQNQYGLTALGFAILADNYEGIALLLKAGATTNTNSCSFFPLSICVEFNQLAIFKLLLEHGIKSDTLNTAGFTALHLAVKEGKIQFIRLLLQNNANPNCRTVSMFSPLHIAVLSWTNKHKSILQLLLTHNADPNLVDEEKNTALHLAARHGNDQATKLLLTHNININAVNSLGNTAIHEAVLNGNYQTFQILIKAQPDLNLSNNDGKTVLSIVIDKCLSHAFFDHYTVMIIEQLLMNGADVNLIQNGQPILLKVIGNLPLYTLLLKYGAKQNISNKYGETALHLAAEYGYSEVVRNYLKQNFPVDQKAITGKTALHYAVKFRKGLIVKLLLAGGADVNAKSNKGETALHFAAKEGLIKLLELLIEQGAQINSVDNDGLTPLHYAARLGYREASGLLIKRGASIDLIGKSLCTPLMLAYYNGHLDVCKLLIQHDPESPFGSGCLNVEKFVIECEPKSPLAEQMKERIKQITAMDLGKWGMMLLTRQDMQLDINLLPTKFLAGFVYTADEIYQKLKDDSKSTIHSIEARKLFYSAIICGRTDVCEKLLLEKLIEIDDDNYAKENYAFSPLEASIFYGRTTIFQLLKEQGADLGDKKQPITSALYSALHHRRMDIFKILQASLNAECLFAAIGTKDEEAVEIILKQGIDVNAVDKYNNPALFVAIMYQQEGIAKLLLASKADPNLNKKGNNELYCPVYVAAEHGQVTLYRMLLKYGAKIDILDGHGNSFMDHAIRLGDRALCELFLQGGIDANSKAKYTPYNPILLSAIFNNNSNEDFNDIFDNVNDEDYEELGTLTKLFNNKSDLNRLNSVSDSMFKDLPCRNNNVEICDLLLQYNADPNIEDSYVSPIYKSIMENSLAILKLLLKYGAKLDLKNRSKILFSMAIENKNIGIIKILLEEKDKIVDPFFHLEYLWKEIIKANDPQIYKIFLDHGIDVNSMLTIDLVKTDKVNEDTVIKILSKLYLNNAVILANSEKNCTKRVYFIKNKALVCNQDGLPTWVEIKCENPQSLCANNVDINMITVTNLVDADTLVLIEEALEKVNLQSLSNKTHVVFLAMGKKNQEVIKILLDSGVDPQIIDGDGRTLLHLAVINDLYSIAEKLIIQGVSINAIDYKGYTPLGLAALYGKKKFCNLLLGNFAQPNLYGANTCPPLQVAYLYGYKDIVKLLLKNNATHCVGNRDFDSFPYKENLPEDKVIYNKIFLKKLLSLETLELTKDNLEIMHGNDEAICELLLDWEKTKTTVKRHKFTALHIAASCGLTNVCKLLLEKPIDRDILISTYGTPLTVAIVHGYLDIVKLFVKNDIISSVTNFDQLLFIALRHKRKKIIKYLVTVNDNVDAVNDQGLTMLALAVKNGWEDLVNFLVKLGADVNFSIKDTTPLHIAVQNGHYHIVKLLLMYNAKFNIIDANNKTAIDLAIDKGNDLIYETLLKEKVHSQQLH